MGAWRIAAVGLAVVVAALSETGRAHAQPWRHAIAPKADAGFQVMTVRGAFSYKHGVDVLLPVMPTDAAMLRALLGGEVESFEGEPATAIVAGSEGADVRLVGCHWQGPVHGVFARQELKSPADLKGTTMAT